MTFGLTDEGYTARRAADFLTVMQDDFAARLDALGSPLPDDYDFARDTLIGPLLAGTADRLGEMSQGGKGLHDAFDIANATGLQLDNLALIVGVPRKSATFSRATVTLSGTVGTVIPIGRLVEGGGPEGTTRWETLADVTVGGGGIVDVLVQPEDPGKIVAAIGAIDTIVTPVAGWDSVTNAADATPGEDREKDDELRARRQASLQITGAANVNATRAALLALDSVQSAVVIENDQRVPAVVQGKLLPANCVNAIVFPATLTTEEKEEVALAIYTRTCGGIRAFGADVTATVTGADGASKTVQFDFADEVNVDVESTATLADGFVLADVEAPIQAIVIDYFLSLGVGDAVRSLSLCALVAQVEGVIGASFTFNALPDDIEILITQIATLGTNTVVVAP